ncbi:MAG TPA: RDD family protein [Methylophilaceae bacterium]|jgi:uncharacterized RDD family membrane protein YckC
MLYESILLLAVLSLATLLFIWLFGDATHAPKRYLLQAFLWAVMGAYFVWCWVKSGQTLAMQTWRIRVVNYIGQPISMHQACKRYLLATLFFGPTFLWALFDREGLFLHDRLTGTRLILLPKQNPKASLSKPS